MSEFTKWTSDVSKDGSIKLSEEDKMKPSGFIKGKLRSDNPFLNKKHQKHRIRSSGRRVYKKNAPTGSRMARNMIIIIVLLIIFLFARWLGVFDSVKIDGRASAVNISGDITWENTLGRLKYVFADMPKAEDVFAVFRSGQTNVPATPLKLSNPLEGRIEGVYNDGTQCGVVWRGVGSGNSVYASADGLVEQTGILSWGRYIMINHVSDYKTLYIGFDKIMVSKDDIVRQGQEIGTAVYDDDGRSEIYLQVWDGAKWHDPRDWFDGIDKVEN